jgi:co-chaperonin GroES (HSP10)
MSLKGQATITAVIIGLVSAVIGFTIIDTIVTPMSNSVVGSVGEMTTNRTLGDGYGVKQGTLVITNATQSTEVLLEGTDYSVVYHTGALSLLDAQYDGSANVTTNATFEYFQAEYLNSSISRTVAPYIVPVGLLGVLAMAAFLAMR